MTSMPKPFEPPPELEWTERNLHAERSYCLAQARAFVVCKMRDKETEEEVIAALAEQFLDERRFAQYELAGAMRERTKKR